MKTIFEQKTVEHLVQRFQHLTNDSTGLWGKMNAYQMLVHCNKNIELLQGRKKYSRVFLGRIFGKMALKSTLKNDKPMSKNSPTHPSLVIKEEGDISSIKNTLITNLQQYLNMKSDDYHSFVHPFFGKMTMEQVGQWEYKHLDHHLRQFGL